MKKCPVLSVLPDCVYEMKLVFSRPDDYAKRGDHILDTLFNLVYVYEVDEGMDIGVTIDIKQLIESDILSEMIAAMEVIITG